MNYKSIAIRLNGLFLLIITAVLLVSGGLNYVKNRSEREGEVNRQVQAALARLSSSLPGALWAFDKPQVQRILDAEMAEGAIVGLLVTQGHKVLGGSARTADSAIRPVVAVPPAHDLSSSAKLSFVENGTANAVGEVAVYVSLAGVHQALNRDLVRLAVEIVVSDAVVVLALSLSLSSLVLRPLARVREALQGIADGEADLSKTLPTSGIAEFSEVSTLFNSFMKRMQRVVGEVRQSSDALDTAAREIAIGNQDLSNRTETQAGSLQQTAHSMDELTRAVKLNTEHAEQANEMAQAARDVAVKGGEVMVQMVGTMGSINRSSSRIGDIVSVIDGIAFQTNILALNAAVEAARAGEQGRGFAVVASEVRTLAQRSAAAAKEINGLIADSVQSVEAGTRLVDEAGATMQEVVGSVRRVTERMAQIVSASNEQMSGIEHINHALKSMDAVTQQNAALVEQAAAAAESMQGQTQSLGRVVSVFRVVA